MYNRVTSFIATLFRDFSNEDIARDDLTIIIVTHGLTLRLFLMRWFHYSIQDFEESYNPDNGKFVVMERVDDAPEDAQGGGVEGKSWYKISEGGDMVNFAGPEHRQGSLWKLMEQMRAQPALDDL